MITNVGVIFVAYKQMSAVVAIMFMASGEKVLDDVVMSFCLMPRSAVASAQCALHRATSNTAVCL